jgi:hypothetical protein
MTIKLTFPQKLRHYSLPAFLLIVSLSPFYKLDFTNIETKDLVYSIFLIASTVSFIIKRKQLEFKEFEINSSPEDFQKAIKITSEQNEWKIKKINDNHVVGFQHIIFSINLVITIIRQSDKIFINCTHDLDLWSEGIEFGLQRKNVNHFITNLRKVQNNIPIIIDTPQKWGIVDYLLRIIAYPTCVFMIIMSSYLIIHGENILFGVLLGCLGFAILIYDFQIIKRRITPKR